MAAFSSSGHINDPLLVAVFSTIATKRLNGIMRAETGKFKKELYFRNGMLVGGRSNILKETFGRVLFENGLINQPDYESSLKEVLDKKKKHGAVLQEQGLLPININDALKLQLRMRLVYTFSMTDGVFHFKETEVPDNVVMQFSLPILGLVAEGVRLHMPGSATAEFTAKNMDKLCVKGQVRYDPSLLNLSQEELNLMTKLISGKQLKQVMADLSMDAHEVNGLLFLFTGMGFIAFQETQQDKPAAAAAAPKAQMTEEHKRLLEEFKDKYEDLKDKNYYECLGVGQQVNAAAIKKAYFLLAKQYHPDHFFDYPHEIRELSSEIFTLVTTAYESLTNDDERKKYDEYLKTGKKQSESEEADKIVKAELQFQKGQILLKTNNLKEAYDNFKWAVELNPTEGEYLSYFGWTTFKLAPDSDQARTKSLEYIQRGLQLNKEQDTGYYFLGRILKVKGDEAKALEAFRTSYAKNPHNIDALREIRAYELSQKGQKGVFKKFFK